MRTSPEYVKAILGNNYDGVTFLDPFILAAQGLVDRVSAANTEGILSSTNLEVIEGWLAAHFYGVHDQFYSSRSTGGASGNFQGQTAMVFNATFYGQNAMALDVTGTLAAIQQQATKGKMRASAVWLGTRMKYDDSELASDQ